MEFKLVAVCAFALMVQSITGQAVRCGCAPGCSSSASGTSISSISGSISSISGSADLSSGGEFPVTSISAISPNGMAVDSEISLGGKVDVAGGMPFLSAVQFQADLPTSGSGCVDYSCGQCGSVGITSVQGSSNSRGCGCIG